MTFTIIRGNRPETQAVSNFERLIYFDLAEKFGHRVKLALFENKPPEITGFFGQMAAHFALAAMAGRPDAPDAEPEAEPPSVLDALDALNSYVPSSDRS